MKTTRLFFMVSLVILGVIAKGNAQITPDPANGGYWGLTGNSGTSPSFLNGWTSLSTVAASNFIGTTGNQDLIFRRNFIRSGWLGSNGTSFGVSALFSYSSTATNTYNSAFGVNSLSFLTSNTGNTAVGAYCLNELTSGGNNTAIGFSAGLRNQGGSNVFIGYRAGEAPIGDPRNSESHRLYIDNSETATPLIGGHFDDRSLTFNVFGAGTNTTTISYANKVTINGGASSYDPSTSGASGLKFANLRNGNTAPYNSGGKVLTVDNNGDVVLTQVSTGTSGITNSCNVVGYIPNVASTSGNLGCSSIFDDGAGHVGFGFGSAPNTAFNVSINGSSATFGGTYNVSDKKFKKDIKPIDNALEKIMNLEGKTYHWRKDDFKEINFTNELQYGLIAQDVEKVIPSLVLKSEKGDLAMNYIGMIPVLIEAIKEQQNQINDLKSQISEHFKAQNQDLIKLTNTKIISVSPNPSNDVISVSFNIEPSVASAKLQVHDLSGNVISSLNINDRENNITRTLQKDNFGKGIYIVSLIVNGKSIDTKKIIFN